MHHQQPAIAWRDSRLSDGMGDGLASQECHNKYQGELLN
jgi:hypothetical protein